MASTAQDIGVEEEPAPPAAESESELDETTAGAFPFLFVLDDGIGHTLVIDWDDTAALDATTPGIIDLSALGAN